MNDEADDEWEQHDSHEEAFIAAWPPLADEVLVLHEDWCEVSEADECTCAPLRVRGPAAFA